MNRSAASPIAVPAWQIDPAALPPPIMTSEPGSFARDTLARRASLSVAAFSRFFKLRTGKTLPQYVNELRIGRACRLLADERLKVTQVALECGFTNLANFNRRFRDITRLTPREYRRKLQESAG